MRSRLGVLFLAGACACTRGAPAPVAPVAQRPVASAPTERCCAADSAAARPSTPRPAATPQTGPAVVTARRDTIRRDTVRRDTSNDAAFLDSLREMQANGTAPRTTSVPREAVRDELATLVGGQGSEITWDLDVLTYASHDRVQYWMDYFAGRARGHFTRYLERAGRYDSMILTRLSAASMPQDLLYLALIESGFNQNAVSRAGAVGLWQFIPATGRRYGLTFDQWVDDRRDPFLATDAAIRFLSELNDRFHSYYLAAAAYNGGPGRVQRGLAQGDFSAMNADQRFFALADGNLLRQETRDYVPKLIAAALLGKQPQRYGFAGITRWEPLRYDSVSVDYMVGMDVVARLAGSTRDALEDMNARFYRGVTPPDRVVWIRVPGGTGAAVAERLVELPSSERVSSMLHVVSRGETLSGIARRHGVTIESIRSANNLSGNSLQVGQRLVIITSGTSRAGAARAPVRPRAGATSGTHIVRSGETLFGIAQRYGVSLDDLLSANDLTRSSVIRVGQRIRIPN